MTAPLSPADADREAIDARLATMAPADVQALARLLALGTRAELRAELAARRDWETHGTSHTLTPTSRDTWAKGLVLAAWDALAGGKTR